MKTCYIYLMKTHRCIVCKQSFHAEYPNQKICSHKCRRIRARQHSRASMFRSRSEPSIDTCTYCGFPFDTITHKARDIVTTLCPNHQSLANHKGPSVPNKKTIYSLTKSKKCIVCGYSETVDTHHGYGNITYTLCPNHHALITRRIKTLEELLDLPK